MYFFLTKMNAMYHLFNLYFLYVPNSVKEDRDNGNESLDEWRPSSKKDVSSRKISSFQKRRQKSIVKSKTANVQRSFVNVHSSSDESSTRSSKSIGWSTGTVQ